MELLKKLQVNRTILPLPKMYLFYQKKILTEFSSSPKASKMSFHSCSLSPWTRVSPELQTPLKSVRGWNEEKEASVPEERLRRWLLLIRSWKPKKVQFYWAETAEYIALNQMRYQNNEILSINWMALVYLLLKAKVCTSSKAFNKFWITVRA